MTAEELNYALRFVVLSHDNGVEVRCFRSPQDAEGVILCLTRRESEQLAYALAAPGFHSVLRDESRDALAVERSAT
jgi:hypothetical protein